MSKSRKRPSSEPVKSTAGALDVATQAAQQKTTDAGEAATRAWEVTGRFLNRFVYTACYTVSYGVVFPSVLLARAVPRDNAAVRGLIDGANAARRKVDELYRPSLASPEGAPAAALAPA
jgi:hypothetical protein